MNNKLYKLMNWPRIEGIIYSEEDNPHEILGPHVNGKNVLFQTFWPGAASVQIVTGNDEEKYDMEMVDESGYFAYLMPGNIPDQYEYEVHYTEGVTTRVKDAYRYEGDITLHDIDKFNAGIHYTIYEKLGAHYKTVDGVEGTSFAVWAPNALRVSVVGDFNHWDGRVHQMKKNTEGGIFEIFIPDVKPGECYKYELKVKGGLTYLKADPYASGQQLRPETASIVCDFNYKWKDKKWMEARKGFQQANSPISVYELYLGSFKKDRDTNFYLNYRELAPEIVKYIKEMGYTHVELLPIMEHPLDASWGYQVIGYYAPTARYGSAEDFMYFIDTLHQAGIGVILDWVPAHFPRDTYGLSQFDGTGLYEHADPRQGAHPHWGTLIYNYGRPQVANYLIANALYWVEKFHADGIRMDAVASMLYLDYGKRDGEWVANIYGGRENLEAIELLKHLNSVMKKRNPGVLMIAEESTAWPKITGSLEDDGLGFDLKWNMGFMNDFLTYIGYVPYFRPHHHGELTFSMIYAYSENFMIVFSHDEVVHGKATMIGKMPGTIEDKFSNLRATYAYMMTHPGKKLLFMGQDIAEFKEFDETRETEWALLSQDAHKGVNQLVKDLNKLYREKPALHALDTSPEGFQWINCISPEKCMLSFLRKSEKEEEVLVVVVNFANVEQEFTVGVPYEGKYREILNTDDKCYGGLGRVNGQALYVEEEETDGNPYSFKMTSAPLSASIFAFEPYTEAERAQIEKKKAKIAARLKAEEAQREAEEAKAQALKAREEAEEAKRLADEAEVRAREAEKKALAESKRAQEEAGKYEALQKEETAAKSSPSKKK